MSTRKKALKKIEIEEEELDIISSETKTQERFSRPTNDFGKLDLILKSEDPTLKYESSHGATVPQVKWGQRKLILTALQFFNLHWNPEEIKEPTCVYIGAAPGVTVNVLWILYPMIKWELFDSAPMNRGLPEKNVTVHKRYFKDKDVELYKDKRVFLISDIRNPDYINEENLKKRGKKMTNADRVKNEEIAMMDMFLQQQWVIDMNPEQAQLKFRLAYIYNPDVDEGLYPYLQGIVYHQPYIGKISSECRLVPTKNENGEYYLTQWNSLFYQDSCFYYNTKVRNGYERTYNNPYTGRDDNISPGENPELINDWDSLCETTIIRDYLNKMGKKDTLENVLKISAFITAEINRVREGDIVKSLDLLRREQRPIKL